MSSMSSRMCTGGAAVNRLTVNATPKFSSMPTTPMPSGEMPNSQFSGTLAARG